MTWWIGTATRAAPILAGNATRILLAIAFVLLDTEGFENVKSALADLHDVEGTTGVVILR